MKREIRARKGNSKKVAVSQVRTGGKQTLKTSLRGKEWWTQAIAQLPPTQQELLAICATTCNTEPEQLLQECVGKHLRSMSNALAGANPSEPAPTLPAPLTPLGEDPDWMNAPKRVAAVAAAFGKSEEAITRDCIFAGLEQVIAEYNCKRSMEALIGDAVICIEDCDTDTFRAVAFVQGMLVYYDGEKCVLISLKDSIAQVATLQDWWGELEKGEHHFNEPAYLRWLRMVNKAM